MLRENRKTLIRGAAAAIAFSTICLLACYVGSAQPAGAPPWYGIVPPLLAVTLALVTNRMFLSLAAAVVVGGVLSVPGNSTHWPGAVAHAMGGAFVFRSVTNADNLQILLYVVLIMAMISVVLVAGGLQGVATWLEKYARSARSTKLVTMATGLIIFIDDYANTMIVGSTLRPVTDRQRISREKLAFLVDATAAPVAGIAIISTWVGYEVGLLSLTGESLGVAQGGYEMFFDALGYRFYCIGMIGFVFFNALSGRDFGPMAAAERRAGKLGKVLGDDARPMTSRSLASALPDPKANVRACVALVPMAALLAVFVGGLWLDGGGAAKLASDPGALFRLGNWREVLGAADSIRLLTYASGFGLVTALALARTVARISLPAMTRAVLLGLKGSLLPVTVLVLAWSLKGACDELNTGRFLANALGDSLPPMVFPALVFVVAGVTSFATGTSWGTMAILIPTAVPVAFQLDGGVYGLVTVVSVAAILDGSIFGDHCSPISDTTIMSSAASACDHLAHVRTQIPYSLVVAGIALGVGYLPAAMGAPRWVGILGGAGVTGLLFLGLWIFTPRDESP